MKYEWIAQHQTIFPVDAMCRMLQVSRSGYYASINRPRSRRAQANAILDDKIAAEFARHHARCGSPRIARELRSQGESASENRIARRMRLNQLRAKHRRKFKVTTDSAHNKPIAENLLQQDFAASAPNQKWVSDITYVWTDEGWLYLAVVLDLYARRVIGWQMSTRINAELVCGALQRALFLRRFPKGVVVHTDRGSWITVRQRCLPASAER